MFSDKGIDDRSLIGAYETGEGLVPCSWLTTGRFTEKRFTGVDLLLYFDTENGYA